MFVFCFFFQICNFFAFCSSSVFLYFVDLQLFSGYVVVFFFLFKKMNVFNLLIYQIFV
ncbi:hypothetical protein HanRHA438_Chr16g0782671 [Helianthus annuus]|nr:hypothetical protein HanRHA438_Chr16g0782671 [Helianthus annuus]